MHIACMIGSLSKGGSERVMCNLIQYFIEHNHQVTLVTQYKGNDEYPLDDRVNRIISDINPERVGNNRVLNFIRRFQKLQNIWKTEKPDAILVFIGKNNFMALLTYGRILIRSIRTDGCVLWHVTCLRKLPE